MRNIYAIVLSCAFHFLNAQYTFSGVVTNEQGEPLESATVFMPNTNYAAATDEKGRFSISDVSADEYILRVTYVGYNDYEEIINITSDLQVDISLSGLIYGIDQIEIKANRLADLDAPFTYLNVEKEEIQKTNLGQDMPQLLQFTPSTVATSDAGAGIGYTGLRIRGSDASRINVTINGIPLNDSESQGVFWVNLPDLGSSVENIQIQRGLGTSTAGAGAFGATIGINTHQFNQNPYAEVNATYGSFNTSKLNARIGTGLMNDAWTIDFRYSIIQSDGYIDRASSDLDSWNFSVGHIHDKGSLRLDVISGRERTYQSWFGTPESRVSGDMAALGAHYERNIGSLYETAADSINLFNSDRTYNYYQYENQVDDYKQDHYQLHWAQILSDKLTFNSSFHYTYGRGFFEEFRYQDDLANYGLADFVTEQMDTFQTADIVRRRWLDNDFFGALFNFKYDFNDQSNLLFGGAINRYNGDHFGRIVSHQYDDLVDRTRKYYENTGNKTDFNVFAKLDYDLTERLSTFLDLQYRQVDYKSSGVDNDMVNIGIEDKLNFFNPKVGLKYDLSNDSHVYGSFGIGNREPVRNDYIDASVQGITPKHEQLQDLELGFRKSSYKSNYEIVFYYMNYRDQLVLTGALNDVGSNLRTNVDESYRMGIELAANWNLNEKLSWSPNLTLSRNKIQSFTEIVYDYTTGFDIVENEFENTDISFSPNVIGASRLSYNLLDGLTVEWLSKYVGSQFLDNTSNENKKLDAYWVNDLRLGYDVKIKGIKTLNLNLLINNILNTAYSANGYTYSFIFEDLVTENFLYPQAGTNFLLGVTIRL